MQEIAQIKIKNAKGFKHVAFSNNGLLACSDMSADHQIYVFDLSVKLKAGE